MADLSLIVKIGANLKDFNKGMNDINKKINQVLGASGLVKFISAAGRAGAAIKQFGRESLTAASKYQQAHVAFTKLIGDAETAKNISDKLTDFAYSTPFDYDGLMKDAQALYQVGVAGNQIIPMLTAFSEAAAGIGKGQAEIDAMTNAIVHMQSVGEADVRTFESINRVGIPAWKMLAKAMNTTEQAAKDAVEKHMVSAAQATEVLVKGMNDMYAGMMKLQETSTYEGAMANLKGNVEHTMVEIGRIIAKESGIIPAINQTSAAYDRFAKTVRDSGIIGAFIETFGPKTVGMITGVGVAITTVAVPAIGVLIKHMIEATGIAGAFRAALAGLSAAAKMAMGAALGALAAFSALVAYKAALGVEGYNVEHNPEGNSEEDEAAIIAAQAAHRQAEERRKAAKANMDAMGAVMAAEQMAAKLQSQAGTVGPVDSSAGSGKSGSSGSGKSAAELEDERRQKAMQAARDELSSLRTVQDAMRESAALRKAYMTAAASETYEMKAQHEDAVQRIQDRWQEFEIAYIGMSDEERARTIDNLEKMGAAYKVTEEGRLSLAEQINADILAENKRYMDETTEYYIQCKDLMAERDEVFRTNSLEALQALLTEENAARLNAYNTQQSAMQRYYENWLEIHKTTKERTTDVILNTQSSFENFFTNVMSGAKSFGDSLLDLVNDILREIMSSIAKMLASKIVNSFLSMFGGGGGSGFSFIGRSGGTNWGANPFAGSKLFNASGGYISGPGSGTSDSIPAWLSNGEYVISAGAVSRLGVPFLNALNRGQAPHFAKGGYVGGSGGTAAPAIVNIYNETGQQMSAKRAETKFDGKSYVTSIWLEAFANNDNGMRDIIKGAAAT